MTLAPERPDTAAVADTVGRNLDTRALGRVLVTGGSSGLGAAIVEAVAKAGGEPLVLDLNPPGPLAIGEGVAHEQVDLTDGRATEAAVRRLAEAGPITSVVAAAGIDVCGPLDQVSPEAWERVIAVNLLGTAAVVRAALPSLKETRGRVVTVASTAARSAASDATAYCASKFGVVGFTRALAAELVNQVGVTLLIPGGMQTNFFADRTEQYKPGADYHLNSPRDVAAAVVFALSQPEGCELREMLIAPAQDVSWA